MFEQDFIMRQIRQFTHALERIVTKKKDDKPTEALEQARQSLQSLTAKAGITKTFHELSLEETLTVFQGEEGFSPDLAFITADILLEEAELLPADKTEQCYAQALLLYKKAMTIPGAPVPLVATQKISLLKKRLNNSVKLNSISKLLSE